MKQIYIVTDGEYYKIGFTSDIDKRIKQIQTGNAKEIKYIKGYESKYSHRIEKELHSIFKNNKIKGEWFDLSIDNLDFIDKYIKDTAEVYKSIPKLSNKKEFMKKWTDRKLNMEIKKGLSLLEKEILFDILDYTDNSNIINFQTLSDDYGYSPSKMSKAKKGLEEKGIIRKVGKTFFLNPLLGIKEKEISQELIEIFQDTFERYNVEINFK